MNINGHMLDTMNTFNPFFCEKYGFECTLNVVPEIRRVGLFRKVPVDTVQVLSMGKVLFCYDHDPKQYPNEGDPTPDEDDIGFELYSHITDFIYENFDENINEKKLSQGEIQDLEVARFKEVKARIDGQDDFNWNGYSVHVFPMWKFGPPSLNPDHIYSHRTDAPKDEDITCFLDVTLVKDGKEYTVIDQVFTDNIFHVALTDVSYYKFENKWVLALPDSFLIYQDFLLNWEEFVKKATKSPETFEIKEV